MKNENKLFIGDWIQVIASTNRSCYWKVLWKVSVLGILNTMNNI